MSIFISCLLAYLACGLYFQAKPKRSTLDQIVANEIIQHQYFILSLRGLATALLFLSMHFAALAQGYERGIAIWLGISSACGLLGLLICACNKHWHFPSLMICLTALFVSLCLYAL